MKLPSEALCTIIIPTLASAKRKKQLHRAVQSIQQATSSEINIIICANGQQWDLETLDEISQTRNVLVYKLEAPSLTKAIAFGRSKVTTQFFGFLDDDDYLAPSSLDWKIEYLLNNSEVDVLVTNGLRSDAAGEHPALKRIATVSSDPMLALFQENWLPSCGGLFRDSSVKQSYFENHHAYAEWTWLAFQLAMDGKNISAIDRSAFVITDSPDSLSKSEAFQNAYLNLYERMLDKNPSSRIKRLIRSRISAQLHDLSQHALIKGRIMESMKLHLRSLSSRDGLRYWSYTRHIISATLGRPFSNQK